MHRRCPECGTEIRAYRGMRISNGPSPPKWIEHYNDDVRHCSNPECEGVAISRLNPFAWVISKMLGESKERKKRIQKAKSIYKENDGNIYPICEWNE
jgi:hypothetical protein